MGISALWRASVNGHLGVVDLLLRARADPLLTYGEGQTPLHGAAAHGHGDIVQILLAAKAFADAQDQSGATALHFAVTAFNLWGSQSGKVAALEHLLAIGASTVIRDVQ